MITDNEVILTEILLWLPAKSLLRFKLVSKWWFSIISSRYFSCRHTLRHRLSKPERYRLPKAPHDCYILSSTGPKLVPYNFPSALKDHIICSSSNGLLLLCPTGTREYCHVYNPTTKQSRKIPYPNVLGLNIAFDPTKSHNYYKIIRVRFSQKRLDLEQVFECQAEIYDFDTSTWKLCGEPFQPWSYTLYTHSFDGGVYWNNGIHWDGSFFDFDKNDVKEHPRILVPQGARRFPYNAKYFELNGSLHCITQFYYDQTGEKVVAVLELQRDYSQWLLKHLIDLEDCAPDLCVSSMIGVYGLQGRVLKWLWT